MCNVYIGCKQFSTNLIWKLMIGFRLNVGYPMPIGMLSLSLSVCACLPHFQCFVSMRKSLQQYLNLLFVYFLFICFIWFTFKPIICSHFVRNKTHPTHPPEDTHSILSQCYRIYRTDNSAVSLCVCLCLLFIHPFFKRISSPNANLF